MTKESPWATKKSTTAVVYTYHALRISAILLQPIMPSKAAEILDRLAVPKNERAWDQACWPLEVNTEEIVERLKAGADSTGAKLFPPVKLPDTQSS